MPNLKNTIQYYHLKSQTDRLKDLDYSYPFVIYLNTKMMIVDSDVKYRELKDKVKVDLLLFSKNAKVKMSNLINGLIKKIKN